MKIKLFLVLLILCGSNYAQRSATGIGGQISSLGGGFGIRQWQESGIGYEAYMDVDFPESEYAKEDFGSSLLLTFGGRVLKKIYSDKNMKYYGGVDITYRYLTQALEVPTGYSPIPYIDMDATGSRVALGGLLGTEILNSSGTGAYCLELGYFEGEIKVNITNSEWDIDQTDTYSESGLYWSVGYRHYFW